MSKFMIYGATGYSGKLAAEQAVSRGLKPILAGRRPEPVEALAKKLGLDWIAFDLTKATSTLSAMEGLTAVLNTAGPFSATADSMIDACLATGTHYTDITGEIAVFEAAAARDAEARAAGVMILPGVGFDVVPSDCLAAHVAARLPDATHLRISIGGLSDISRGTAKTMLEAVADGILVRRDGQIVEHDRDLFGSADFGEGTRTTVATSWGDVSTAWHSTHIPNIEVHFEANTALKLAARLPRVVRAWLGNDAVQNFLKRQIDKRLPEGPTQEQRQKGRAILIAEAWNARGERVASRLNVPEGYTLTAWTAIESVRRAAEGQGVPGFQTPSKAFGADYILEFDGVTRTDF